MNKALSILPTPRRLAIAAGRLLPVLALAVGATLDPPRARAAELPWQRELRSLGTDQGLSHTSSFAVVQDRTGFIWVGTQDGLDRFDGRSVTVFRGQPGVSGALSSSDISTLLVDRAGALWVGTWGGGLGRLDPTTQAFETFTKGGASSRTLRDNRIQALFEDRAGRLWVGTYAGGLSRLESDGRSFTTFLPDPSDPTTIADARVWAIGEDREGALWVSTKSGINRLDRSTAHFTRFTGGGQPGRQLPLVRALLSARDGRLWVGTERGLGTFDPTRGVVVPFVPRVPSAGPLLAVSVNTLLEDRQGRLWIGSGKVGLFCLDPGSGEAVSWVPDPARRNGLANGDVRALLEDRTGVLWIATRGGGVQSLDIRAARFARIGSEILGDGSVWALAVDHAGALWVGTEHGLDRLGPGRQPPAHYRSAAASPTRLPADNVNALLEDSSGRLWVGTWGGGLGYFDRDRRTITRVPCSAPAEGCEMITSMCEGPGSVLWVGTRAGLSRLDPSADRLTPLASVAAARQAEALLCDRGGMLWIGTDADGLIAYDPRSGASTHYQAGPSGLSDRSVRSLWDDPGRGLLWVGTSNGLNALDRTSMTFTPYKEQEGLPNASINTILGDAGGRLWLSTNRGLSRFDPGAHIFHAYTVADGLQGNVFSHAGCAAPDGRLYFGGANGVSAFQPERLMDDLAPPPVVLTGIRCFDRPLALARPLAGLDRIVLSYRDSFFSFEFAALDFTDPARNRFAHKMEGFDRDWVYSGERPFASYTNLDPGHYVFRVRAANSDGTWNTSGVSLAVHILPPPWRTWWAYTLYVLAGVAIVATFVRAQQRKLEREREVSARLRQADRLKDEFLANTSHELRTPLNGIIGIADSLLRGAAGELDAGSRGNLTMIVSSARRLAHLVNDLLDFTRLRRRDLTLQRGAVDMRSLTDIVLTLSGPLVAGKAVALANRVSPDLPLVDADEDRVQQILHNLVGNAIKFTESGSVAVSATVAAGWLEVTVSDTGVGIPAEAFERIFQSFEQADGTIEREYGGTGLGLAISRQLVELHGGTIRVSSEVGRGSDFTFTLPVSQAARHAIAPAASAAPLVAHAELPEGVEQARPSVVSRGGDGYRILIVDDEPVNLQVLANYLSLESYSITAARSGLEALDLLGSDSRFDLVLLDVMMPRMSGFEVCQRLRETHPPNRLPVVFLTAKNQVSDLVAGFSSGGNDYLTKPFSRDELVSRIETHLKLLRINTAMWRFVPHAFLQALGCESVMEVHLGDQRSATMTVLFSDIRSYTTLAESMSPSDNFDFINGYLRRVGPVIEEHGGFVNQYYGDGIMALFGAKGEDAVAAAIKMQGKVAEYNRERSSHGRGPIRIGIGAHTGPLILGIIGDERRVDTGVISDTVNTAARMEGLTKHYGASVVISGETLDSLGDPGRFLHRFLGKVRVKGKVNDVRVYEVFAADTVPQIDAKNSTRGDFEAGVAHFLAADLERAAGCFERVVAVNQEDQAARSALERTRRLQREGVPPGWHGVEALDTT